MAKYSAVKATVNAYIKQNGRKEITGKILNAVLNATIDSLGKFYQFAGEALPTDDPGTPDQNLTYLAGTAGTYTNFGGLTLDTQEIALLMWDGEWKKQTLLFGIQEVDASVDNQVGTPSVDVDFVNNVLTLSFHNIKGDKGDTGDPAGFGQVTASVDDTIGNPSVQVQTSGEDTAKNIAFEFHGLRGETGITSVVVSVDNTTGNPACSVSLVGQVLHLDFTGLKGLKGDTGVSADYPITIYNGLDSDATDQALAAAQGKVLDGKVSQLGDKVDELEDGRISLTWESGHYINTSGNLGNSSAWYYTDYVSVRAGQELYCHLKTATYGGVVALYDVSKNFLSYVANDSGTEFIVPVVQDGFARFSNRDYYSGDVNDPYVKDLSEVSLESLNSAVEQINGTLASVNERFPKCEEVLSLTFINGKYVKSNGELGNSTAWNYTDYYPVKSGQKLYCHLYTLSDSGVVALYDVSKNFLSYETGEGDDFAVVVSQDGFVRFSNRDNYSTDVHDPWVENITNRVSLLAERVELANERIPGKKPFWLRDFDAFVTAQTNEEFVPSTMKICHDYRGQVSPAKRYVAIGFDDFRASDFSMVIPLFDKYGARAVFNRIARGTVTTANKVEVSNVLYGGHELGDHTFLHYKFPFDEPLFNGQDPNNPDGSGQSPYPTNAQMRSDRGDGKNAFGIDLTTPVSTTISYQGPGIDTAWGDLSDAECQTIRDYFSVMKDTQSGLGELLDTLSNKYLGTTGNSVGSWDAGQGCYTGGIFTGCKTSENHEIWERILQITELYYKDEFGLNYNIKTWSLPGSKQSGCYFEQNGKKYYDENHTIFANNLAKMTSSLYRNEDYSFKSRSWTDVLKEFGYFGTHDATSPGRIDGNTRPAMFWQLIINASLSRKDALPYNTNRSVSYSTVGAAYPSSFFHGNKTKAAQMYDDATVSGVPFKTCIEAIRHNTASGMIHGEIIDSQDNFSMKVFFEEILRFCRDSGIEVITKAEAYDVAFNHIVENGNLIYNPLFVNSAEKFLLDAETVPTNPDGYIGNCSVAKIDGVPVLTTTGETKYTHWGIPIGDIEYSAMVKGTGTIGIYAIKNNDRSDLAGLTLLHTITVNSPSAFADYSQEFYIAEAEETAFEQICDGLGEKVCGVQIVYSSGLQVQKIKMFKK